MARATTNATSPPSSTQTSNTGNRQLVQSVIRASDSLPGSLKPESIPESAMVPEKPDRLDSAGPTRDGLRRAGCATSMPSWATVWPYTNPCLLARTAASARLDTLSFL